MSDKEKKKKHFERNFNDDESNTVVKVNVNLNCGEDKQESANPSAFRAVNVTGPQNFPASVNPKQVEYPNEVFDLNDEYNPVSSTFIPKQAGVYMIIGSIGFQAAMPANYTVRILIVVGETAVVFDNDFWGEELTFGNIASVSGILRLSAGDEVRIFANSSTDGNSIPQGTITHFEAARISSIFND
ncbi:hypothetical protein M3175_09805 [Robertmurraya korlensis]|uniref:hypothetical protein n=1 Tax=Robertmurraya korlensis TaxID=519977 RepID=UPI00203E37F7|nr:hypothetical protein [Robertmurraya korlensis]MCM3601025.1 hypothetical protein [Robertmurraya korlensis]